MQVGEPVKSLAPAAGPDLVGSNPEESMDLAKVAVFTLLQILVNPANFWTWH
jgi:hypothetical protein